MKEREKVPIPQKANLTIAEAAEYSGISEKTLRNRIREQDYDFILRLGSKTLIKRKRFERFLEEADTI